MYVPLHRSCTTGRYEVSGFLFIAAENRECVERLSGLVSIFIFTQVLSFSSGLRFFKSSLNYSPADIGQKFIFFVDKDFSYIEVIKFNKSLGPLLHQLFFIEGDSRCFS